MKKAIKIKRDFISLLNQRLSQKLPFIQVVLGPRQVGKTTGVQQALKELPGKSIFANADLPTPPTSDWIIQYWNQAQALGGEVILVLDEIQKIPRWSDTIKMLYDPIRDKTKMQVVILGSASLTLSAGLEETLAGRFEVIEVPHWSFLESKKAFAWSLEEYLAFGGYPAAALLTSEPDRWQDFMQRSIIDPMLARDILGVKSIKRPALFRQTLEMAMLHPTRELSYQKFIGQLQDPGSISTIKHYLEILEAAFTLKTLPKYSASLSRQKSSTPKILPLCPALVHTFQHPSKVFEDPIWKGYLFELVVGAELVKRYKKVSYWRKGQKEVDYIVEEKDQLFAIEVKLNRSRSNSGLSAFLKQYPKAITLVINKDNFMDLSAGRSLLELIG